MSLGEYADAAAIRRAVAGLARPLTRKSVSAVVAESLRIETPGGFAGPWDRETFPYMAEPLDMTSARNVQAVVFCGPAQCGKTFSLIGGRIVYAAVQDPADQLLIHMSQDTARDWSRKELDRWIKHSPDLRARQSSSPRDDNTFDKFWADGSVLKIAWPSPRQVASKSVRDGLITDYDRMPDDIGGEGSVFGLLLKRLQAWLSRGIAVVESSPGRDIPQEHAHWTRPAGTHQAPPVGGILGLYNSGDRRRWYWPCPFCRERFEAEPGVRLFGLPDIEEIVDQLRSYSVEQLVARHSAVTCPHCAERIEQSHKRAMNIAGRWLVEGERMDAEGLVRGEPRRSSWASYWLGGAAAAFQSWPSIVERYLQGVRTWSETGKSDLLKQTVNTDQAMPFRPMGSKERDSADALAECAGDWQRGTVPDGVRFLLLTADVQGNRFVCQVFGFGPGAIEAGEHRLDWWLVDRYVLRLSKRNGAPLNPPAYLEDWQVLSDQLQRGYPLTDGSGRVMFVRMIGCDSAGKAGATSNAYDWWRGLPQPLKERVRLVKGEGKKGAPRAEIRYPDTRGRADRDSGSRGDVPVVFCGSSLLKDALAGAIERAITGGGGANFPADLPAEVYEEMLAERRDDVRGWICRDGARNEAIDLAVYAQGLAIAMKANTVEFWRKPPAWAMPWDSNSLVYLPDSPRPAPPRAQLRGTRSTAQAF